MNLYANYLTVPVSKTQLKNSQSQSWTRTLRLHHSRAYIVHKTQLLPRQLIVLFVCLDIFAVRRTE